MIQRRGGPLALGGENDWRKKENECYGIFLLKPVVAYRGGNEKGIQEKRVL